MTENDNDDDGKVVIVMAVHDLDDDHDDKISTFSGF